MSSQSVGIIWIASGIAWMRGAQIRREEKLSTAFPFGMAIVSFTVGVLYLAMGDA